MRRRDSRGQIDLPEPIEPYRDPIGGCLCLDFVNTVDVHSDDNTYDYLFPGYGNLVSWALFADVVDEPTAAKLVRAARREPRDAVQIRRRAVALREAIHALATSQAAGDHLQTIDAEWLIASSHRHLVQEPASGRLTWQWPSAIDLDRVLWPIVASAVDLFTGDQLHRVRECDAPGCGWVFLDTTRNGNRRFCRPQGCGNRTRVRRFREGQAAIQEQGQEPA
jgi:predicted RNA-binding Zn ribbon-like protein